MERSQIYQIYYVDYPLSFRFGSYLALFRPMAIKHLVVQLYDFSDLHHQTFQRLQKTRSFIRDLIEFGIESEQGEKAIQHMNGKHVGVGDDNHAFRYVLSCFFLEPFRWNRQYDNNLLQPFEKQLVIDFWCKLGERMAIKNLWYTEEQWLAFQASYESRYMSFSTEGQKLANLSLRETPKIVFPTGARNFVRQSLLATMDENVRSTLHVSQSMIPAKIVVKVLPVLNKLAQQKRVA